MASYTNMESSSGLSPEAGTELLALYASLDAEECDEATGWTRIVGVITIVAVSVAGWAVIAILVAGLFR